jgi:hypothetical protein
VWKVKEQKKVKTKRVSFANPIATELKAPKTPIQDDSIMLIKGTTPIPLLSNVVESVTTDNLLPFHLSTEAARAHLKEKSEHQGFDILTNSTTSEQFNTVQRGGDTAPISPQLTLPVSAVDGAIAAKEMGQDVTNTTINLCNNMELQLGTLIDNILVSSLPRPIVMLGKNSDNILSLASNNLSSMNIDQSHIDGGNHFLGSSPENSQSAPSVVLDIQSSPVEKSNSGDKGVHHAMDSTLVSIQAPIDAFLESVSNPVPQSLLTTPQCTSTSAVHPASPAQNIKKGRAPG